MIIMLQRPVSFQFIKSLVVSVIAVSLAACNPGTETTNTTVESASPPASDTATLPSTQAPISPASGEILGVNGVEEINFRTASETTPISGYFDTVNNSTQLSNEVSQSTPVTVGGWAILPEKGEPADRVIITYGDNNSIVAVAPVDVERPDVAKNLQQPAYENSGWNATFDSSSLPPGEEVVLKAWAYDSTSKEATQLNNLHQVVVLQ